MAVMSCSVYLWISITITRIILIHLIDRYKLQPQCAPLNRNGISPHEERGHFCFNQTGFNQTRRKVMFFAKSLSIVCCTLTELHFISK